MARRTHTYSPQALDAARLLGLEITRSRRARRWTQVELAERAGISRPTLSSVEQGAPTVAIGVVFEVAALVGIDLFEVGGRDLPSMLDTSRTRLQLLPRSVRPRGTDYDDDF